MENWSGIPAVRLDCLRRRIFTGENVMLARNVIDAGASIARHSHPHEQILYVLSGECDATIQGETRRLSAGCVALIPPGAEHEVRVTGAQPLDAIDIFSPIRKDFLPNP
jgi:quercetin dioxygenase-like cupin family protein